MCTILQVELPIAQTASSMSAVPLLHYMSRQFLTSL